MSLKNFLTLPYNLTLTSLNYLQDKISSQPKTETFDNVKIKEELKEERMSFEELVMSKGYPLEIHYAETEDGYILKIYRIPAGKGESNYKQKQKQSVFIMHGIFDSSDAWVCNSEDKCIPFILANYGYDVWLGNSRGNKHSRYHKKYNGDSNPEFWNFSFNEMGQYDIPASLNHVTNINKWSEKVIYIGHSQGTTLLFAALTQNLEYYQSKIKLFIAFGPVALVANIKSKLMNVMQRIKVDCILEKLAFAEVFCHDDKLSKFNSWLMPKVPSLCTLMFNLLCDIDSGKYNNAKRIPVYLSHIPGGGSLRCVSHFVQNYRTKKFRMYDYGAEMNKILYGQSEPKDYDLTTIHDIPIALYIGDKDKLSTIKDAEWLKNQLGDNVIEFKILKNMGHSTFMMADDMTWFNDVVELMDLYL